VCRGQVIMLGKGGGAVARGGELAVAIQLTARHGAQFQVYVGEHGAGEDDRVRYARWARKGPRAGKGDTARYNQCRGSSPSPPDTTTHIHPVPRALVLSTPLGHLEKSAMLGQKSRRGKGGQRKGSRGAGAVGVGRAGRPKGYPQGTC
jgi:hypothetical protein